MNNEARAKIIQYIEHNPMAVLSTINDDGTPHSAVVYICVVGEAVCFITKNQTRKYQNILERPYVSITIGNDKESSTLQLSGKAYVLQDAKLLDMAMKKMSAVHAVMAEWLPPIAKLRAGSYAVVGVGLAGARLGQFRGLDIGSREIFTEF